MEKENYVRFSIFDLTEYQEPDKSVPKNVLTEPKLFTEHLDKQPWSPLTMELINDLATPMSIEHITNYLYEDLLLRGYEFEHDYEFTGIELNQRTSHTRGGYVLFSYKKGTCKLVMNGDLMYNKDVVIIALHELAHLFLPADQKHNNVWKAKAEEFGKIYSVKGVSNRTMKLRLNIQTGFYEIRFKMTERGASFQTNKKFQNTETIHMKKSPTKVTLNKYKKLDKEGFIKIVEIVEK